MTAAFIGPGTVTLCTLIGALDFALLFIGNYRVLERALIALVARLRAP